MNFLKNAASAVTAASKMAADSAKRTYADLKAEPTKVRCSGCPLEVDVPPTTFEWTCTSGHVNHRRDELCTECKVAQPAGLPEPTVTCMTCQAVTPVPSSNARKHAREAAVKTKEFAAQTAAATKAGVDHLRAAPTTFHCAHCNTLLAVPTGPWACQTCTTENAEDVKQCKQCGQKKSDQKAICGVCRQSTVIPSTNFGDGLRHTVKDIRRSTSKIYYDVSGKPYLTCQKCNTHVSVPPSSVSAPSPSSASSSSAAAVSASAANVSAEASEQHQAPVEGGAGLGSAPPPATQSAPGGAPEGTYNGEQITCPACKNVIEA